jgi:TIR domain
MQVPRAFISYSHDSQSHKQWVMEFAVRLRNSGVDAILDQWELQPGDDIPHFMETNLALADRVLMICTENYVRKANAGTGGVGYEKMIVTSELMSSIDSKKVVPIIRQSGTHSVPTFLKTKLFIDFSSDTNLEYSYDELVRTLLGAPLFKKPPIGSSPFTPVSTTPPERTADALLDLMKVVVSDFESGPRKYVLYKTVVERSKASRVLLDIKIKQAIAQGLLKLDPEGDLVLTDEGKLFAIQHKLVKS